MGAFIIGILLIFGIQAVLSLDLMNFIKDKQAWEGCLLNPYYPDTCATNPDLIWNKPYVKPMALHRTHGRRKRNALKCQRWLWPNGIVPYELKIENPGILARLFEALSEMHAVSCVKFVPKQMALPENSRVTPEKFEKIFFSQKFLRIEESVPEPGKRCRATVGITVRKPVMHLSDACTKGQILHELMHVLGFAHEHMRPDRDHYVKIHCENIIENMTTDFRRLKPEVVDEFGEPYDFRSIMHYRLDHFSKNGLDTIEPIFDTVPHEEIGQMKKLSGSDVRKLNKLYKC